jgi:hypothetical protein
MLPPPAFFRLKLRFYSICPIKTMSFDIYIFLYKVWLTRPFEKFRNYNLLSCSSSLSYNYFKYGLIFFLLNILDKTSWLNLV